MIHLISSFFRSIAENKPNELRNAELEKVLLKNLAHPQVGKISLFLDDEVAFARARELASQSGNENKIIVAGLGVHPLRFSDIFEYTRGLAGEICMVSNADIYLHHFEPALLNKLQQDPRIAFILSRHESDMSSPFIDGYGGAHDAYVFTAPMAENVIHNSRHPVPVRGGENVVIWEMKREYCVLNPCRQVVIVHEHETQIRNNIPRPRINYVRKGFCRPVEIPTEKLDELDLLEWADNH